MYNKRYLTLHNKTWQRFLGWKMYVNYKVQLQQQCVFIAAFPVSVQNGSLHQKDTVHDSDFEPYLTSQSSQVGKREEHFFSHQNHSSSN